MGWRVEGKEMCDLLEMGQEPAGETGKALAGGLLQIWGWGV